MAAVAVVLCGCAASTREAAGSDHDQDAVEVVAEPTVGIDGDRLVLLDGDGRERVVAVTDPATDGELLHAALRPGDRDRQTVLALTRAKGDGSTRYELRYLSVDGHEVTD